MPSALRNNIDNQKGVPGPGTYTPTKATKCPQCRFPRGIQRASFVTSKAPGPGAYSPNHSFTERRIGGSAVFGTKKESNTLEEIPGPGAYNTCESFNVPSVKIATASRNNTWDKYKTPGPGPAAYSREVSTKTKGVKFNKAKKNQTFDSIEVPGPGSYLTKTFMGTGTKRALILSRRLDTTTTTEGYSPGPGAYQIVDKGFVRGIKIGRSKRRFSKIDNIPSPFQYTPRYELKKQSDPAWR